MTCGCAMDGGVGGWMMGPVGLVLTVGLWALLVWGGITLVRHFTGTPGPGRAKEILARRFATGEIDEAEYQRRLEALHETAEPRAAWPWGAKQTDATQ